MGVQGAINQAIGAVGTGIAVAKGVKAEGIKAQASQQSIKEAEASALQKLGSNEQMLAKVQEKINDLTYVRDEKKANLIKYGNTKGITKGAKKVLTDAYQNAQLALEGAEHEREGIINFNQMLKEQIKGGVK